MNNSTLPSRISRTELYLRMAQLMGLRKTCPRAQGGAVITVDQRVVSTGYAGAPSGMPHCTDVGCLIVEGDPGCQRTVHAEISAITFSARHGISINQGILYTTYSPCLRCAQAILNSGIVVVYYEVAYRKTDGLELLSKAGISTYHYPLTNIPWIDYLEIQ